MSVHVHMCARVCTGCMCIHTNRRRWRCVCNGNFCFPEPPEVSSQALSCLNKRPSVRWYGVAFSGPFRSLLQVQFAPSPALMGCRLRPWTITLSRPSIYGTGKAFSLNKSKKVGWVAVPSAGWPGALAVHEFQGSPQAQTHIPSRPPGFFGGEVGWE